MMKMEYESVEQAAKRLGVTARAIQKWAAGGKIPHAKKVGRPWLIPVVFTGPVQPESGATAAHRAMPLLSAAFEPGHCLEYIDSITDPDDRNIAMAEYYYFSGRAEEAAQATEGYLDHRDPMLALSANFVYTFANIGCGKIHLAQFGLRNLQSRAEAVIKEERDTNTTAVAMFFMAAASVFLHLPKKNFPNLEHHLYLLPMGLKLMSAYILAHRTYLDKDYSRGLGITDMAIAIPDATYPIARTYINLISAVCSINMKDIAEAERHFNRAIDFAEKDGFLQPFAEHHGLLQGMIEKKFKFAHPKAFKKIIALTEHFSKNWRKMHNTITNNKVTMTLTTTEFSVAMLYSRGWAIKEIAHHLDMSERMIKKYVSDIYEKLDVNNREHLHQYLLT